MQGVLPLKCISSTGFNWHGLVAMDRVVTPTNPPVNGQRTNRAFMLALGKHVADCPVASCHRPIDLRVL